MSYRSEWEFGRVAVLMGGWAGEREVSLVSGAAVLEALLAAGVDAHGVDVGRDIATVLQNGNFDRVFNIVHGRGGEDGELQGLLEILELPYTGSGLAASAVSMNKLMTKSVWLAAGLKTPEFEVLHADSQWDEVVAKLGLPLMVKPACEGSSLGMSKVNSADELPVAWRKAAASAGAVFAERWIHGEEYTVGVLGERILPAIELRTQQAFYDYHAKYVADDTQYICPCELSAASEAAMQAEALRAFTLLGARDWGRIDIMRDAQGVNWLIELNTVPGMTSHSLVPMAARQVGMDMSELVCRILAMTLKRSRADVAA